MRHIGPAFLALGLGILLLASIITSWPQPTPPTQARTYNAPAMDLSSYEVIALEDSVRICKPTGPSEVGCSPPLPPGCILLIPQGPRPFQPDTT